MSNQTPEEAARLLKSLGQNKPASEGRDLFEAALQEHAEHFMFSLDFARIGDEYTDYSVDMAWVAWNVALSTPEVARGNEARDAARLDWLEMQDVEVRTSLRYGSRKNFITSPEHGDGELLPSDLRAVVDAAMAQEGATNTKERK